MEARRSSMLVDSNTLEDYTSLWKSNELGGALPIAPDYSTDGKRQVQACRCPAGQTASDGEHAGLKALEALSSFSDVARGAGTGTTNHRCLGSG